MKSLDEVLAPVTEMGWRLNHIFAPIEFPNARISRKGWGVQIWSGDFSSFAQGDGPTLDIAVARAVISAKAGLEMKPKPKININLDDLELDL